MSETDTTLITRASTRLHALLDRCGITTHPLLRHRHLAADLGISMQESEALLSGLVPWSMGQLAKICQYFDQRPGFFLDPGVDMDLPPDTTTVTSTDGGEPIVWRAPGGHKQHNRNGRSLNYFTIMSRSHFGGNLVPTAMIYQKIPDLTGVVPFHECNVGYVLADGAGAYQPAICSKVSSRHIQFDTVAGSSPPFLLPLNPNALGMGGTHVVGRAIGTVSYLS